MNSLSVSGKNWIFKKFNSNDINTYKENFSLNEIIAKLLSIKKINIEDVNLFLNPKIKNLLPDPLKLKDMDIAVNNTYQSILKNNLIGIFGDYDVDGASSTALLSRYFNSINIKFLTHIPNRHTEGYGPTIKSFENFINKGVKTIFTVDCGTSSYDAINYAQKLNTNVIVLDHHQSDIKLPNACAIVNPNRYDEKSSLSYLCAAGVCFVFLVALNKKLRQKKWFSNNNIIEPDILQFLDLVSLGTVCDVVPLIGLNRALVKQGLKIIKNRSNLGIKTLYDICKIENEPTTFDLGYKLGPRINAGGRVGKSSHGAELLISNDPKKTFEIAMELEKSNEERRAIETLVLDQITSEVEKFHNHPILVMSGNNWHEGVIGIVASRIKDKFKKPTILISVNEKEGKGSARSIIGFDIGTHIIKAVQSGILIKGGGHKMAGGFSIKEEKIPFFRDFLISSYEKLKIDTTKNLNLYIDSTISPSALNESFYNEINFLAPFGSGNNEPRFLIENIKVRSTKLIAQKHIKSVLIGKDGTVFKGFLWNGRNSDLEQYLNIKNKKMINIVGKIYQNDWQGKKDIEFIIEDISIN